MSEDPNIPTPGPAEERILVSRSELMSGILVGISGEHDAVPTQQQLDRAVDLMFRAVKRRDEGLNRLLAAIDAPSVDAALSALSSDGEEGKGEHRASGSPPARLWAVLRADDDAVHDDLGTARRLRQIMSDDEEDGYDEYTLYELREVSS